MQAASDARATSPGAPSSPPSPRPGGRRATRVGRVPRRLALGGAVLALLGAGAAGWAAPPPGARTVDAFGGLDARPAAGRGTNYLLMGLDDRDTITAQERSRYHLGGVACGCSDVMMVLHVAADRKRFSLVSLPRDSYADLPRYRDTRDGREYGGHPAKINAAYAEGGPGLAVRTVEQATGLRMDRYLAVDFRRFMDTVDELGTVAVCTPTPLKDANTGLDLAPGTHELAGGPSLQYVRSRHVDTAADYGRIQRQHRFLVNALGRLASAKTFADPARLAGLARTLRGAVTVDKGFSLKELVSLARTLRDVPASGGEFQTVPVSGFNDSVEGLGSTLRWDEKKAKAVFAAMREDRVLSTSHAQPQEPPRIANHPPVRGDSYRCS